MRFLVVVLVSNVLCACAPCGSKAAQYNFKIEPDPRKTEVMLGVGDTILVNVWGPENRDLNAEVTIRADGSITIPLVGDIKAAGERPSALRKAIETKVAKFVRFQPGIEPVTVTVKAWKSYYFTIQGEVQRQGLYTSERFVTVADAIAMSGGLSRFAKRCELTLFRVDPQTQETRQIPLDYDMLSSGKRRDMNIYVLAGDVIDVP
jgi:polysaccharide export outer membrane protein